MQKSTKARTFAGGCLRDGWKANSGKRSPCHAGNRTINTPRASRSLIPQLMIWATPVPARHSSSIDLGSLKISGPPVATSIVSSLLTKPNGLRRMDGVARSALPHRFNPRVMRRGASPSESARRPACLYRPETDLEPKRNLERTTIGAATCYI
jgi:hypothetical protein